MQNEKNKLNSGVVVPTTCQREWTCLKIIHKKVLLFSIKFGPLAAHLPSRILDNSDYVDLMAFSL